MQKLEALDAIDTAASRAARLTQQLLAFGRNAVYVPENVALAALVPKVVEMLACLLPTNLRSAASRADLLLTDGVMPGISSSQLIAGGSGACSPIRRCSFARVTSTSSRCAMPSRSTT